MTFGYKAITPIKLLNGVIAYRDKKISFKSLRVYLASFELVAIREAAKRTSKLKNKKERELVCFKRSELLRLTQGLTSRSLGKAIKELKNAELMQFSEKNISFNNFPIEGVGEFISKHLGGRKGSRGIPIPRKLIKLLASTNKPTLFITLIAYFLRGLSVKRATGEVNPKGTVKASWIAKAFGISLRSAKSSRAELIALDIISKDETSYQRKLNRTGSYFIINTKWGRTTRKLEFAPPYTENRTEFAPPIKRLKTTKVIKNHKTKKSENSGLKKKKIKPPNIYKFTLDELKKRDSNEKLYWEAVRLGYFKHSEANVLNWLSATVRASKFENTIPIFMGIIKKKLWQNITLDEEDRARTALNKAREFNPMIFKKVA